MTPAKFTKVSKGLYRYGNVTITDDSVVLGHRNPSCPCRCGGWKIDHKPWAVKWTDWMSVDHVAYFRTLAEARRSLADTREAKP